MVRISAEKRPYERDILHRTGNHVIHVLGISILVLASTDVCHRNGLNGAVCFKSIQSGLARKHLHSIPRANMPGWIY